MNKSRKVKLKIQIVKICNFFIIVLIFLCLMLNVDRSFHFLIVGCKLYSKSYRPICVMLLMKISLTLVYMPMSLSQFSTLEAKDGRPGFIVPVEGTSDQFLVGLELQFVILQWDGQDGSAATVVRVIGEVDQDIEPKNRINDGKADPRGRIFAGTMGLEKPPGNRGALFRVDGSKITKMADGIGCSNGLAWDLKEKAFYYTDTMEGKIRRYDYDVDTGDISNLKYIFDLKANNIDGFPDGTTIDTDGNLWVAVFNGSAVIQVDPRSGSMLRRVPLPVPQVTSATWGGPDHEVLFVTTASLNITEEQKPPCGSTYMITGLGVKGLPNVNYKP